jgi:hypothetical protein
MTRRAHSPRLGSPPYAQPTCGDDKEQYDTLGSLHSQTGKSANVKALNDPEQARCSLPILVPYRDRARHLEEFVPHMERVLPVPFQIILIEQFDDKPFNKGKLLNVGFSLLDPNTSCVCLHDIDMLPIAYCDYSARISTTHLAAHVEHNGFRLAYPQYLGGVLIVTRADFLAVNGFSNRYWGYGEEDDDLWLRFQLSNISVNRTPGMYKSLVHKRAALVMQNIHLFRTNLMESARRTQDPAKRKILEERLRLEPVTVSKFASEYIPYTDDGLTTLQYELVQSRRLRDFLNWKSPIAEGHLAVSVRL